MESIITSLANSMLESGTISEVHILLGVLIVTVIAIRKSKQYTPNTPDISDVSSKLDDIQNKLKDLTAQSEITAGDISAIHDDIVEIKSRLISLELGK